MLRSVIRLRFIVATTGCIVDRRARKNADCKEAILATLERGKNLQTGVLAARLALNVVNRAIRRARFSLFDHSSA